MCVFIPLFACKNSVPVLLSEATSMEQFILQPAPCPLSWEMSEKDQSKDPATFYSDPLVLTFKEALKG